MQECLNACHNRSSFTPLNAFYLEGIQAFSSICWPGLTNRMPAGACLCNPQACLRACLKHACTLQACLHGAGMPAGMPEACLHAAGMPASMPAGMPEACLQAAGMAAGVPAAMPAGMPASRRHACKPQAEAEAEAPGWGRGRGPPWRGGAEG